MPKIVQKKARIIKNINLTGNYYRVSLYIPEIARVACPGQFVMLRVSNSYQPLLRRPFSIHRVNGRGHVAGSKSQMKAPGMARKIRPETCDQIEILYEVVGKGTNILAQRKPGESLDVLGPLGHGFSMPDTPCSLLVGGGMGIAPLLFLAQQIKTQQPQSSIQVLIGAKTKNQVLSEKEFASFGCGAKISTDDGSDGFRGKVTELLKNILCNTKYAADNKLYACGPKPMLKQIGKLAAQYNVPSEVSLDEYMACGLGICLGCMINTREGYKSVCKQGPVFNVSEIIWPK